MCLPEIKYDTCRLHVLVVIHAVFCSNYVLDSHFVIVRFLQNTALEYLSESVFVCF